MLCVYLTQSTEIHHKAFIRFNDHSIIILVNVSHIVFLPGKLENMKDNLEKMVLTL